ncbi:hypothetical protein LIER_27137 [Lithospermum erythrorhizon]|uniref:Uncharacterized protein n=1 Tax=Lithospermum erythrorhizon TaxID=34254 RepID=A0AAV3RB87_LITER
MEHNTQDRPGVSMRARSALAPLDKRGAPTVPNKEPAKTPKLPRMTLTQPVMTDSDDSRPSPGMLHPRRDVEQGLGEAPRPCQNPRYHT